MSIVRKCSAVVIGALCFVGTASADSGLKIGYVDIQKALSSCSEGKDAQKKYEDEVGRLQEKLNAKKADFEKLQQNYHKQKSSLSDKARAEKEDELVSREKELKRTFQDSQETLRKRNSQLVGELMKKMRTVVEHYGKNNGYSLVLEKSSPMVLYADGSADITDEVIEKFDESK